MRPSPKSLTRRPINSAAEPHGRTAAGSLDQNDSVATNGPEIGARATASAPDSTSQVSNCLAVPAELSLADLRLETGGRIAPPPGPKIKPGSRLVREWHGRTHTVCVTDVGFEFQGNERDGLTEDQGAIIRRCGPTSKVIDRLTGESRPSLAEIRNELAHGAPSDSFPSAGLLEIAALDPVGEQQAMNRKPVQSRFLNDDRFDLHAVALLGLGRGLARRFRPKFVFPVGSPFRLRVSHHLGRATFPAPASSNAACGFPALRSPVCFASRLMGPILPHLQTMGTRRKAAVRDARRSCRSPRPLPSDDGPRGSPRSGRPAPAWPCRCRLQPSRRWFRCPAQSYLPASLGNGKGSAQATRSARHAHGSSGRTLSIGCPRSRRT